MPLTQTVLNGYHAASSPDLPHDGHGQVVLDGVRCGFFSPLPTVEKATSDPNEASGLESFGRLGGAGLLQAAWYYLSSDNQGEDEGSRRYEREDDVGFGDEEQGVGDGGGGTCQRFMDTRRMGPGKCFLRGGFTARTRIHYGNR